MINVVYSNLKYASVFLREVPFVSTDWISICSQTCRPEIGEDQEPECERACNRLMLCQKEDTMGSSSCFSFASTALHSVVDSGKLDEFKPSLNKSGLRVVHSMHERATKT